MVSVAAGDFGLRGAPIALKLELLQHSGSFKARGAFSNLLSRAVPEAGVVAASGGNHGAAVAFAARRLGIAATIFVPEISASAKVERIRALGATLVVGGARYEDARVASEAHAARTGAMTVHAYDQPETLRGQGTVGLELDADTVGFDTLLVAVGGGGLIGGVAAWFAGRVRVVAVEPETAPTLHAAFAAGEPVDAPAGGIWRRTVWRRRGSASCLFAIATRFVHEWVVLVTDAAIRAAQVALWDGLRVASEPGGAAAFAALLSGAYVPADGERVCVLVCGGNLSALPT